jgi:predicted ATP-dependent Lon-type protease
MKLITIKKAHLESDLVILKSKLEAEGIRCFMKNQYITQVINFMPSFVMELQVAEFDLDEALEILKEFDSEIN